MPHAFMPSAASRIIILEFRFHETNGVGARIDTTTHALIMTREVDTAVGIMASSITCIGRWKRRS